MGTEKNDNDLAWLRDPNIQSRIKLSNDGLIFPQKT